MIVQIPPVLKVPAKRVKNQNLRKKAKRSRPKVAVLQVLTRRRRNQNLLRKVKRARRAVRVHPKAFNQSTP